MPTPRTRRAHRRIDRSTILLAITLLVVLVLIVAWRTSSDDATHTAGAIAPALGVPRTFEHLRLTVPRSWVVLARDGDRVTWGTPDRTHVVTLSSTEASSLPLMSVVRDVTRDLESSSVEIVDGPVAVEPQQGLPRGDSFVLVKLRAHAKDGSIDVVQAWRRDTRASMDVIATWTSTDGAWPIEPRDSVPSAL